VEKFKADEAQRLRRLGVWGLKQAYFFAWIEGLSLDELRREVKRISKTALTAWELRTWSAETYRERLRAMGHEYGVTMVKTPTEPVKVEEKSTAQKKPRRSKTKEGTNA
jgi:hypothetical protein